MINAFGKSIDLKIVVNSDEILFLGQPEEAAGKLLRGSIHLNLTEPIKARSIHLSFTGKMKVSWVEGSGHHQHTYKQERNIINHDWEFFDNQQEQPTKKVKTISPGQHVWNFELELPGNLPESLDSDVGSVSYRLKATVERTAFVQNTVKKKNIRIQRCIIPSEYEMIQSLEIHNTWAQKMVYDISVPSKLYAFNDVIPISFKILPLANHLKVNAIMASIKEYCTYRAKNHTKTDTRICRLVRVDTPFSAAVTTDASAWTRVVDLQVPAKSPLIFSNTDNDMIRIRHKLKFVISLVNADGHYSELRCAVNIVVIESFAATEELTTLPAYDDMWRSVPYEPHVVETLRTRASISEQGTNELNPQVTSESRQPVTISGWSRLLSVSAAMNIPDSVEEESQHSTLPISIPGSNSGSRHHSRRPSFDLDLDPEQQQQQGEEQQQGNPEQQWWEGVDLGKVPSYTSMANFDLSLLSASLPPAYDTLLTFGNSPRSRF